MSDGQRWTVQRSNSAFDDDQFYAMKGLRQIEAKTWEDAADLALTLNALEARARMRLRLRSRQMVNGKTGRATTIPESVVTALARKDDLLRECRPYIKDYRNDTLIAKIDKEVGWCLPEETKND